LLDQHRNGISQVVVVDELGSEEEVVVGDAAATAPKFAAHDGRLLKQPDIEWARAGRSGGVRPDLAATSALGCWPIGLGSTACQPDSARDEEQCNRDARLAARHRASIRKLVCSVGARTRYKRINDHIPCRTYSAGRRKSNRDGSGTWTA